jgi:hypothetical protein
MKTRPLIVLALIALAIVGGAIWFLNQPPPALPLPGSLAERKLPPIQLPPRLPAEPRATPSPSATANPTAPPVRAEAPEMEEWEMQIDQVLRSSAGETETAQILINMLPALPPDGQEEAAQHISNLIQDEDYSRVMPLVRNTSLPEEVHDVFVTDLMNREDRVKLPALLEIAKLANHPHQEEALTDLEIFLDEDYGTNWTQWDAAMRAYLKEQADEESEVDSVVAPPPGAGRIGR